MDKRLMQCPFCGHQAKVGGIGATYCGPHKVGETYYPARRMTEVEEDLQEEEAYDKLKEQNVLLLAEVDRLRDALKEIGAGCKLPMGNRCDSCFSHLNPYCNDYSKTARQAMEGPGRRS